MCWVWATNYNPQQQANKIHFPLEQPIVVHTGGKGKRVAHSCFPPSGPGLWWWELTLAGIQWGKLSKQIVFSSWMFLWLGTALSWSYSVIPFYIQNPMMRTNSKWYLPYTFQRKTLLSPLSPFIYFILWNLRWGFHDQIRHSLEKCYLHAKHFLPSFYKVVVLWGLHHNCIANFFICPYKSLVLQSSLETEVPMKCR